MSQTVTEADPPEVSFSSSRGFLSRLHQAGASLAFSSYQAGTLFLVGSNATGGINIHRAIMRKPMGIATRDNGGFVLSSAIGIECFENGLNPGQLANEIFDACYVPRTVHFTGALDAHDVGLLENGDPIFVNTRFNCLAITSRKHSFEVFWKPDFISSIVDEDRCHLNGLAMRDHKPAFVTAVSRSDTIDGWRDHRADGGVVINLENNSIYCENLSMPHSPRWHEGRLWLLNSGKGEVGYVENNKFTPVAFCPGFVRGLTFHKQYMFIGLSKPRYKRFEGLELDERLKEKATDAWCGIQVIDCNSGTCVDWLRIDGAVSEIYDLALLKGTKTPMAIGMQSEEMSQFLTIG